MSHTPRRDFLTPAELNAAPIDAEHKDLVNRHIRRLQRTIVEEDEHAIGYYTNRQAAREQLARMTLVLRDYIYHAHRHRESGKLENFDETIESAIIDVVDASLTVCGPAAPFCEAAFVNPQLWGREQEVAEIMQEQSAESVDDVIELWNVWPEKPRNAAVLPETKVGPDLGASLNWNALAVRRRSDSDLVQLSRRTGEVEIEEDLTHTAVAVTDSPKLQAAVKGPRFVRRRKTNACTKEWLASLRDPQVCSCLEL